jgi:hypothetical protein
MLNNEIIFVIFPLEFKGLNYLSFLLIIHFLLHIKSSNQIKESIKLNVFMKILIKHRITFNEFLNNPQNVYKQKNREKKSQNESPFLVYTNWIIVSQAN